MYMYIDTQSGHHQYRGFLYNIPNFPVPNYLLLRGADSLTRNLTSYTVILQYVYGQGPPQVSGFFAFLLRITSLSSLTDISCSLPTTYWSRA